MRTRAALRIAASEQITTPIAETAPSRAFNTANDHQMRVGMCRLRVSSEAIPPEPTISEKKDKVKHYPSPLPTCGEGAGGWGALIDFERQILTIPQTHHFTPNANFLRSGDARAITIPIPIAHQPMVLNTSMDVANALAGSVTWPAMVSVAVY